MKSEEERNKKTLEHVAILKSCYIIKNLIYVANGKETSALKPMLRFYFPIQLPLSIMTAEFQNKIKPSAFILMA